MKNLFVVVLSFLSVVAFCQNSVTFLVKDSLKQTPLSGATIIANQFSGTTNSEGTVSLQNLPDGKVSFIISHIGYQNKEIELSFPEANNTTLVIFLSQEDDELEEVIVESTRLNRSIRRIPTRIETLTEEIDEAASMEPSRIAHLITHSTGIQVQTTAASSNGAVVRIQGLQGRYTKILKDGFPLYGGFSGSLDILQIPPLDLRQVEYIKGSASTLYGGGAIAGILNILSKKANRDEILLHLNRSSIGSNDLNAFVAKGFGKWGVTSLASYQLHSAYDADDDGYTDLPHVSKFNFNPKIFLNPSEKTQLFLGALISRELRKGGDVGLVKNYEADNQHFYLDNQQSTRVTSQFRAEAKFNQHSGLSFRNSFSFFNRHLNINENPASKAIFGGDQTSSFTELTYNTTFTRQAVVIGGSYVTDIFKEKDFTNSNGQKRDEEHYTAGIFINHIWDAAKFLSIESGLRTEWNRNKSLYSKDDGNIFVLPRLSALFKYGTKFTSRIGGGLGYRPLTIFNEEAEPYGYKNIQPIDFKIAKSERSYGLNGDIGYQSHFGNKMLLTINHMFFYNQIKNPVVFQPSTIGFKFINGANEIHSKGFETQVKFTVGKFTWFFGYTFTNAYYDDTKQWLVLVPRHSIKGDILFVEESKWRIGWDYEYKSKQQLSNGRQTRDLFSTGVIAERTLGNFVLFFNAENITDVRQSRYESLLSGPYGTTQFTEVWAPLDGRFFNFGFKVKL